MKRSGDEPTPPGGKAERRRRQFEESRGVSGRRALPVDEEGHEQGIPEPPAEDDETPVDEGDPPRDENE